MRFSAIATLTFGLSILAQPIDRSAASTDVIDVDNTAAFVGIDTSTAALGVDTTAASTNLDASAASAFVETTAASTDIDTTAASIDVDALAASIDAEQGKGRRVTFGGDCSARLRGDIAHIKRRHGIPHPEPWDLPHLEDCLCAFLADPNPQFDAFRQGTAIHYRKFWQKHFGKKSNDQSPVPECIKPWDVPDSA